MPRDKKYFKLCSSFFAMLQPRSSGAKAITFPILFSDTPAFVNRNMTFKKNQKENTMPFKSAPMYL